MLVQVALRLAEANAVDDGRVVERVRDERVVLAQQRLENARVGVKARREEDRVLHAVEACDLALEGLVDVLRAADKAHRRQPEAVAVQRRMRGSDNARMA